MSKPVPDVTIPASKAKAGAKIFKTKCLQCVSARSPRGFPIILCCQLAIFVLLRQL